MNFLILIWAALASGFILSLSRKGFAARALVTLSVPVGAFGGAFGGGAICRLILGLKNGGEGQHDWIAWVNAGILGALFGVMIVPTIALAFTGRRKNEESAN